MGHLIVQPHVWLALILDEAYAQGYEPSKTLRFPESYLAHLVRSKFVHHNTDWQVFPDGGSFTFNVPKGRH